MAKEESAKGGFFGSDYEDRLDYELDQSKLPGIPIIFPSKETPSISENIEALLQECEGIPLVFTPSSLYSKKSMNKKEEK